MYIFSLHLSHRVRCEGGEADQDKPAWAVTCECLHSYTRVFSCASSCPPCNGTFCRTPNNWTVALLCGWSNVPANAVSGQISFRTPCRGMVSLLYELWCVSAEIPSGWTFYYTRSTCTFSCQCCRDIFPRWYGLRFVWQKLHLAEVHWSPSHCRHCTQSQTQKSRPPSAAPSCWLQAPPLGSPELSLHRLPS